MLKRLVIILILLNIFPFVYHKHFIGVHSAQAGDFLASEGWDEGGGGGDGGDGGDDGDDDDDDNCTDPGSTTSENQINTYISNGQEWATYEVTSTDNCTGETSSYTYDQLVDDCTSPSYIEDDAGDPHNYYVSGDEVYAKVTHTVTNTCNNASSSYDEDRYMSDETQEYQDAVYYLNNGEQLQEGKDNTDPTENVGADGEITRESAPEWTFYREFVIGHADPLEWTADFNATHVKDGNIWKFKALTFRSSRQSAGAMPLCQMLAVTVDNAIINIPNDGSKANCALKYTLNISVPCMFNYSLAPKHMEDNRDYYPILGSQN